MAEIELSDEERQFFKTGKAPGQDVKLSDDERAFFKTGQVPKSSAWRRAGDVGLGVAKGAVGIAQGIGGLVDTLTPIDTLIGGPVNKRLADVGVDLQATQDYLSSKYSPEMQANQQAMSEATQGKGILEGIGGAISTMYDRPSLIVDTLAQSALPVGLAVKGASLAGKGYRALAASGIEGALATGQVAEKIRQEAPERYDEAYKYAIPAGLATAALGTAAGKIGGNIEAVLANKLAKDGTQEAVSGLSGGILKRGLKGATGEGLEEGAQSGSEQAFTNLGTGKPATEDLGGAIGQGLVAGVAMGGPIGVMNRATPVNPVVETPPQQQTQQPPTDQAPPTEQAPSIEQPPAQPPPQTTQGEQPPALDAPVSVDFIKSTVPGVDPNAGPISKAVSKSVTPEVTEVARRHIENEVSPNSQPGTQIEKDVSPAQGALNDELSQVPNEAREIPDGSQVPGQNAAQVPGQEAQRAGPLTQTIPADTSGLRATRLTNAESAYITPDARTPEGPISAAAQQTPQPVATSAAATVSPPPPVNAVDVAPLVTDQASNANLKLSQNNPSQQVDFADEDIDAVGDIEIDYPSDTGPARLTVNARQAYDKTKGRVEALEMVRRCLG